MKILSKQQVLKLHEMLIEQSGGSLEIRDEGLLESDSMLHSSPLAILTCIRHSWKKQLVWDMGLLRIIRLWMGTRESVRTPCLCFLPSIMRSLPIPMRN